MRRILEWLGLIKDRKTKLLEDLSAMKLVDRSLKAHHATEVLFRSEHRHRIAEWNDVGLVLDTEVFGPDSTEGQAFLEGLNNDEVHKIATELNWEGPNAAEWRLAFVRHPNFDKATAWALYQLADAEFYERKIRENGKRPEFKYEDADNVEMLDAIHAGFLADDFASNDLFYDKGDRVGNQRMMQQQAESEGTRYEWEMPLSAFEPSTGRRENSRYEVWNEGRIMIRFKQWVTENPESSEQLVAS